MAVNLDDIQIMRRVQAGEVELFDQLVRRYRLPLVHAAWSKLGNLAWAEDVVQETFLAAFAARDSFNPHFAFRTWLWTILLNLCRRQWRRHELRPQVHSYSRCDAPELPPAWEPVTPDTTLARVLATENRQQVHAWLEKLAEPQADALRLRFFGGLTFAEIALAMNSSLSAAKQRVKNALAALAVLARESQGD